MVVILGGLTLYLSHLIAQKYMQTLSTTLSGQARLGAELLGKSVEEYYRDTVELDKVPPADRESTDRELIERSETSRQAIVEMLNIINARRAALPFHSASTTHPRRTLMVMRTNGEFIADSPPNARYLLNSGPEPAIREALDPDSGIGMIIAYSQGYDEELLYIAVPIYMRVTSDATSGESDVRPAGKKGGPRSIPCGILVLAAPTTDVKHTISQIQWGILLAFIGGLLVLFLINAAISSFISRPLDTLSDAAGHFANGDLHRRVQSTGALEIASLGESFNSMAAQLETTIANLNEERAQAQAILASMFDGVMVTDPASRILLINQSLEQTFDLREEEIVGKELVETIFHSELDELLQKTIDTNLPLMHQVSFSQPTARTFEVHMAPVTVGSKLLGVVIALYDVTNQRKLEQVRRDFVANVSHELRTPVASIRAMAETLADGGCDDPQIAESFLGSIIHESERLTALLEDLLQLAQIESGRRLITPEWIDLAEIIRYVGERLAALVSAKEQQLVLDIPDRLPAYVDRDATLQIVLNLIDNARKYSPEGGSITVHAERINDDRIRIKVTDTGIGIPEDEQDRIFERFYRVDKARSRGEGGTGLGLAIVQHLVELHDGWISVQSEQGHGSQFVVVLPQPRRTALPEEAGELPSGTVLPIMGSDA
jgi:two-component system phosphate regulon sensor histidine kinase PhoR